MWIAVIFVCLAIVMMLGPIMLMQPSKRQRRLATLRATANEHGLQVRMKRMPDDSLRAGELVALYYHRWPGDKTLKNTWLLTRQPFGHGLHFAGEWDWSNRRPASPEWHNAIRDALSALPDSVVAVEAASQSLGVCWLEQTEGKSAEQATEEISVWLKNLMAKAPRRF